MTASEWKELNPETVEGDIPAIFAFLSGATGFDQQTWSRLTKVLLPDRGYNGRISQKMVRYVPESSKNLGSARGRLKIGLGLIHAVDIPLFGQANLQTTYWRTEGDTLVFRVIQGDEPQFERRITPRRPQL